MGAADLFMRDAKTNRILDSDKVADRKRMAAFIEESAAAGATGIGHAPGYMGSTRTHIGGGLPEAVWGTDDSREGAPRWVIEAFERGRAHALTPSQVAEGLLRMRQTARTSTPPTQVAEERGTELRGEQRGVKVKALANVRKRFAQQVHDPDIRRLVAASTAAEVGGQGPKAAQDFIESVFNRAAARGKTLQETLTDRHYYPQSTLSKLGRTVRAPEQKRIDEIIDIVMAGSNQSNLATGNESGDVRSGGAEIMRDYGRLKERFVREIYDLPWITRMEAAMAEG